ncbi:hypothetical protein HOY82DRAFT_485318 [Tuber indicum]|nr:hypothetical protein HOY82DRAFT_485318 [Tuber indicum]
MRNKGAVHSGYQRYTRTNPFSCKVNKSPASYYRNVSFMKSKATSQIRNAELPAIEVSKGRNHCPSHVTAIYMWFGEDIDQACTQGKTLLVRLTPQLLTTSG